MDAAQIEKLKATDIARWQDRAHPMDGPHKLVNLACNEIAELRAEVERLRARFEYIEDHATTRGGGHGFTVSFFVPVDCEDIGCGIDAVIEKEKA